MKSKIWLVFIIYVTFFGCNSDNVQDDSFSFNIKNGSIKSIVTGIQYKYKIYIPNNITKLENGIPIIYATDGGWHDLDYYKALENNGANVVLVNLWQGPDGRRETDFLLPGVHNYYQFFSQEFIPHIEQTYNIKSGERTLVGHSHGGTMVGTFAYLEDPNNKFFTNYLAFDSSFWLQQPEMLQLGQERYAISSHFNGRIILTSVLKSAGNGNYQATLDYEKNLKSIGFKALKIDRLEAGITHWSNAEKSFVLALDTLFPNH